MQAMSFTKSYTSQEARCFGPTGGLMSGFLGGFNSADK